MQVHTHVHTQEMEPPAPPRILSAQALSPVSDSLPSPNGPEHLHLGHRNSMSTVVSVSDERQAHWEREREMLVAEIARLSRKEGEHTRLQQEVQSLREKEEAAMQLVGEKVLENEDLRLNMQEVSAMFRKQISQLFDELERVKGKL